jgi:restriction endonuclease Mrr
MNALPPAPRPPGRASTVGDVGDEIISIAVSEYELIDALGLPIVLAVAFEKVTLPKSASEVNEHDSPPKYELLQSSGRSTTHSAEDWAAPEKPMVVEKFHPECLVDESLMASVHSLPATLTDALIESPGDTGYDDGKSSTSSWLFTAVSPYISYQAS